MNYFCTAGRGTEKFAAEEIVSKLGATNVQVVDGKVFFCCDVENHLLISRLKSVERVFAEVLSCREPVNTVVKETVNDVGKYILKKDRWAHPDLQTTVARIRELNTADQKESGQHYPPTKKKRSEDDQITFRVSCKCSGRVGRHLQAKLLSCHLGQGLRRVIGWSVDLRNPDVEISVHLNDEGLTVGIPLQRVPLSKRDYIKHFGLRSTIAWIMTHLLQIQPGDRVVDPMCGKATLLLEAARHHQSYAEYIGIDNNRDQLTGATHNLEYAELQSQIQLLKADAARLPIKPCSVDRVVTDAPFGQKFVPDANLKDFYQSILIEISRILKPQGRLVLLTSRVLCQWLCEMFSKRAEQQQFSPVACSDASWNKPASNDSIELRPPDCIFNKNRMSANVFETSNDDVNLRTSVMESMDQVIDKKNLKDTEKEQSEQGRALSLPTDVTSNSENSCVCQTSEKLDISTVELSDLVASNPKCRSDNLASGAEVMTKRPDLGGSKFITSVPISDTASESVESGFKLSGKDREDVKRKETVNSINQERCYKNTNQTDKTDGGIHNLNLAENHYVKLGETDAFICIFVKS